MGPSQSVKLCPSRRWPAAFLADLREGVRISWIEIVCSVLCGIAKKADCVKSNDKFLCGVAVLRQSLS